MVSVPLWKQFYLKQKQEAQKPVVTESKKEDDSQSFYKYLFAQRKAQKLPPVFAMLTGPLIRPYRMEETRMILGRITPSRRLASLHVGSLSKISHKHCSIEWDREQGAYVLELISPNGVQVGPLPPAEALPYYTPGTRITLPNPCQIIIQTIPMFFQCFYVSDEPEPEPKPYEPIAVLPAMTTRSRSGNQALSSGEYRQIITEALQELGGRGTQKQIAEIIERKHPEVLQQKTWRNSVSGILSSNAAFSTEAAFLPSGKRARYSMWVLNSMKDNNTNEEIVEEQLSCGTIPLNTTDHHTVSDILSEPPHKKAKLDHKSDSDSEQLRIDSESDEETLRIDDGE